MSQPGGRTDATRTGPSAARRRSGLSAWEQLNQPGAPARGPAPPEPNHEVPRPVPELVQFWFEDVTRVEGPSGVPTRADHLSLYIDDRGMEVSGRSESYRIPWIKVSSVSLGPAEAAPGGGMVRPFDVVTIGEGFRLLLPTPVAWSVRMDALAERLPGWSAVTVDTAPRPPVFAPIPSSGTGAVQSVGGSEPSTVTGYGVMPFPPSPYGPVAGPPRSRKMANLVVGLVLVLAAVGLAFTLSRTSPRHTATATTSPAGTGTTAPASATADRQLAQRTMLTQADVPSGWTIDNDSSDPGTSPEFRTGEAKITTALATCMGITPEQANVVLGGQAPDQTAQATSPIFAAPSSGTDPGFALQLQTAANVVRTSADQARDSSLLDESRYPACEAAAVASELQLGANHASGGSAEPGPATASELHLAAPAGESVSAVLLSFNVTDQDATVPVQVEVVSLGSDRVEANLQAFALGGAIPAGVLDSPVAALERRLATTTSTASV